MSKPQNNLKKSDLEYVLKLRDDFVANDLGLRFYTYQREVSDAIIIALLSRTGEEIPIEISRQAGKTEAIVCTLCFLMAFSKSLSVRFWRYEASFRFIIFSPQKEQAKTDFDRLKGYFQKLKRGGWGQLVDQKESNQTTLQIANGSYCYIFPLTPTSNPESKTADMIIYEEAHKIIDQEKKNKADPMGASTNAPEISVGVAWYQKNYFKNLIDAKPEHLHFPAEDVIKERRRMYEQDGDERHLLYERHYNKKLALLGPEDASLQTQYQLKWKLEAGNFMSEEDWKALRSPYVYLGPDGKREHFAPKLMDFDIESDCYAGIDTAKHPDSTVVTIVRWNEKTCWKELVALLELHGTNYSDQFTIISGYDTVGGKKTGKGMFDYFNVVAVSIDSTGQGSFMPDYFKTHTKFRDERSGLFEVKFSLPGKDMIYTNLMQVMTNRLTAIPADDTLELRKMRQQLIELQKEYKGQFLICHHPEDDQGQSYHDDYPDSWALAEHSFAMRQRIAKPKVTIL